MTFRRRQAGLFATAPLLASITLGPTAIAAERPDIKVAVQQIVNAGALDVLRERSNVGARIV